MSNRLIQTVFGEPGSLDSVRIYKDTEFGEYCCKLSIGNKYLPDADYFTPDRLDALETAHRMLNNSLCAGATTGEQQ